MAIGGVRRGGGSRLSFRRKGCPNRGRGSRFRDRHRGSLSFRGRGRLNTRRVCLNRRRGCLTMGRGCLTRADSGEGAILQVGGGRVVTGRLQAGAASGLKGMAVGEGEGGWAVLRPGGELEGEVTAVRHCMRRRAGQLAGSVRMGAARVGGAAAERHFLRQQLADSTPIRATREVRSTQPGQAK